MDQMDQMAGQAVDFGFSHAKALNPATLHVYTEVRDMCAADRCGIYDHCWTCPPACGSLDEHRERLERYHSGIIVQTTGTLEDQFDFEGMQDAGTRHQELFRSFAAELRPRFTDLLALGSGGCNLCESCTWPTQPCRHPEKAISSMEAYGLFVSEVCRDNDIPYTYGSGTITYIGCYLWNEE